MASSARSGNGKENGSWPELPLEEWKDTYATLHMWTQVVGKIRFAQTPWINHSWHVTLYVTCRGLTTSPIPYRERTFQMDFDFIDHRLVILTSDGDVRSIELRPRSVADFYGEVMAKLHDLGLNIHINTLPNEVADPIRFEEDDLHSSYNAEYAHRLWKVLVQIDRVFKQFRAKFIGKCSPVHFFWGSFDMAVTRFSGRTAPPHPGGVPHLPDVVAREAYSHEVSSCGFWPGGDPVAYPIFYSYAYPAPDGFEDAPVKLASAFYSTDLGEFILPYDEVRKAEKPDKLLLDFLQSTYEAAATLGKWDRKALERDKLP